MGCHGDGVYGTSWLSAVSARTMPACWGRTVPVTRSVSQQSDSLASAKRLLFVRVFLHKEERDYKMSFVFTHTRSIAPISFLLFYSKVGDLLNKYKCPHGERERGPQNWLAHREGVRVPYLPYLELHWTTYTISYTARTWHSTSITTLPTIINNISHAGNDNTKGISAIFTLNGLFLAELNSQSPHNLN